MHLTTDLKEGAEIVAPADPDWASLSAGRLQEMIRAHSGVVLPVVDPAGLTPLPDGPAPRAAGQRDGQRIDYGSVPTAIRIRRRVLSRRRRVCDPDGAQSRELRPQRAAGRREWVGGCGCGARGAGAGPGGDRWAFGIYESFPVGGPRNAAAGDDAGRHSGSGWQRCFGTTSATTRSSRGLSWGWSTTSRTIPAVRGCSGMPSSTTRTW